MSCFVSNEKEKGQSDTNVETKRCLIRTAAIFRMTIALVTMLVSGCLGGIIVYQATQNELITEIRAKWKTIFWIYSGASLVMFFISLRLVIAMRKNASDSSSRRRSRVICGMIIMAVLMGILEAFAAGAAFIDSGILGTQDYSGEGAALQTNKGPFVSLMALSGTFAVLCILELVLFALIACNRGVMANRNWSNAIEPTEKAQLSTAVSVDELDHFIRKPNGLGSTEILQYTEDFTVAKLAPDSKVHEDTVDPAVARPMLPQTSLVESKVSTEDPSLSPALPSPPLPSEAVPENCSESQEPQNTDPRKEQTTPKLQRKPSFKRIERRSSLTRRSSTASRNPNFPPYEGTRFEYYSPERGTFARPIDQDT